MTRIALQAVQGSHRDGSTPGVDRRFTERDLHAYPELYALAIKYLEDYTGTFDPLLSAQSMLDQEGRLPVNIAKLVLNCAYSDPSVQFKLDLSEQDDEPRDNVVGFPPVRTPIRTEPEIEDEPLPRRHRLRLPAKIKAPFGMSRFNGKVLHRVRLHSAYMEWPFEHEEMSWRNRIDRDPLPTDKRGTPTLYVSWVCGGGNRHGNPLLFTNRPKGLPYCRGGCFSDICARCGKMIHLDPKAEPDAPVGPCPRCDVPINNKRTQRRDERKRLQ